MIKLIASRLSSVLSDNAPGTVVSVDGKITVACGDGLCIDILEVLPAGKKRMSSADYLRGNKMEIGDAFASAIVK